MRNYRIFSGTSSRHSRASVVVEITARGVRPANPPGPVRDALAAIYGPVVCCAGRFIQPPQNLRIPQVIFPIFWENNY